MAVTLDGQAHHLRNENAVSFEIEDAEKKLHGEMKKVLSSKNYSIYEMLFIENLSDEEVAAELGYRTTEKGRKAGYKQIKNLKKQFKQKAEKILKNKDIFYGQQGNTY